MKERSHYEINDNNMFAFALGQASGYYDFLLIILDRYEKASKEFVSVNEKSMKLMRTQTSETVLVTDEQMRLLEESSRLTTPVHLEIESFYLFAKVLLDTVARFLYVYFGQGRGVRPNSHNDLAKHHEKYLEAKGLVIPEGLSESIMLLKESICDYRDDEISHELSLRRIRATAWSGSGGARIASGMMFPRKGDKTATSAALAQLMKDVNVYIGKVIMLIESNRDKSRLRKD
jgi:hypothetical protein